MTYFRVPGPLKTKNKRGPGAEASPELFAVKFESHSRRRVRYLTLERKVSRSIRARAVRFLFFFFFFFRATDQQYGIRTKKSYLKTTRSCMDTPMNMYSSKGHIKRLTGAFFLADIQTMTYTQVHRYLGHASMFLLTLHQTMSHSVAKSADQS